MAKQIRVYDGTQWVDLAQSVTDLSNYANLTTTPISGFRNAIINGDFRIWQRGSSFASGTSEQYTADRFRVNRGTGTYSVSRQAFPLGNAITGYESEYFHRMNISVAGDLGVGQKIEDVRTFAGQTISVSFWAKTASASTLQQVLFIQDFGTGGSSAVVSTVANLSAIATSTSWTRYTGTLTLPSISGKTIGTNHSLYLRIDISETFTGDFDIWGVQVEKGSIATPFEQRPIGTELALCQRYYYKWENSSASLGLTISSTWYGSPQTFPVQLRTSTPTITTTSPGVVYGAGTSISVNSFSAGVTTSGNVNVWQFTASLASAPASYTWTWCTFNTHSATFNAEL